MRTRKRIFAFVTANPEGSTRGRSILLAVERTFVYFAVAALLVTAVAKLGSAFGENTLLERRDPVFIFFTNRQVLLLGGFIELAVCTSLFLSKQIERLIPLACLSVVFAIYKVAMVELNVPFTRCPCFGIAPEWTLVQTLIANVVVNILLLAFLAGSLGLLVWGYFFKK